MTDGNSHGSSAHGRGKSSDCVIGSSDGGDYSGKKGNVELCSEGI